MALNNRIYQLLTDQLNRELTDQEHAELNSWAEQSAANELLLQDFGNDELLARYIHEFYPENWKLRQARMERKIFTNTKGVVAHRIHFLKTAWFKYAAAIVVICGIGAYLWNDNQKEHSKKTSSAEVRSTKEDVLPGSDKAVLTLADGQQVLLDNQANAVLTQKGIINTDALLVYSNKRAATEINTLTTPKGGQYKIKLSDGTMVWLNAVSSITYPTNFTTSTREVNIIGEAYFEVAKNAAKPFVVKTPKDHITVLGTSFNVNAYVDEAAMKTSLVEGSVRIGEKVLQPGQAYVDGKVMTTNVDQDVAWKNGVFNFHQKKLPEVMRQLGRWYDVDIRYDKSVENVEFGGRVGRNLTLLDVLEGLEGMEVHFTLQGKTLSVSK